MTKFKANIDILLIIVAGFVLRLVISFTHSYSNDELSAVTRLRFDNFSDLITFGVMKGDMHPAGVQVFMKGWSSIFGTAEVWMRLPFVLFGTFSIFLIFYLGKRWFNRSTGLFAAGLLAFLYFPILNSELARPYSVGLMISLLVMIYFDKVLLRNDRKWSSAILLGVFMAGAMYTHYFAFLYIGFIGFTGVILMNGVNWKYFITSAVVTTLLFAPHIPVTIFHLQVGGLQWLGKPDWDWLFQFLFFAFNDSWIVFGVVLLLILGSIFWSIKTGKKNQDKKNGHYKNLCLVWFFGIFLIGYAFSYISTPVLKFPVMLFPLPALLLYLSWWINRLPKKQFVLWGLLILIGGSSIVEKTLFENNHFALFKEPGMKMADWNERFGAENIYTIYHTNNPDYINFYKSDWGGEALQIDQDQIAFDGDYAIFDTLMNKTETYCVIGYSSCLTLVQTFETVRSFYPVVVDFEQYNNGAVFLLRKDFTVKNSLIPSKRIANFSDPSSHGRWEYNEGQVSLVVKEGAHYSLYPESPYGPNFISTLEDLPEMEDAYLKAEVVADLSKESQLTVAFSVRRNGEPLMHRGEMVWQGRDLERSILPSENNKGFFAFKIPYYVRASDELMINLWNRGEDTVLIKRFQIDWIENFWND